MAKRKDKADEFIDHVAGRVYEVREAAGMTMLEIAEATGLSHDAISKVELGKRTPTIRTLYLIAKGLSVDVEELVGTRGSELSSEISPEAMRLARYVDGLGLSKQLKTSLILFVREVAKSLTRVT